MCEIICRPVQDKRELCECFFIRKKIFVEEQNLFNVTDCDEHDEESIHIAAFYKKKIIGTVRIYQEENGLWWGGRLAVDKRFRGRAGKLLVQKAVEIVKTNNIKHFRAYVQLKNVPFFKSLKWKPKGTVFHHYGKPHQLMEADLE